MLVDALAELIKVYLIPGSISFLLAGLGLVLLVRFVEGPRSRTWLWVSLGLFGLYWTLATPAVSGNLEAGLDRGFGSLSAVQQLPQVDAIVVLGGGAATYRSAELELDVPSDASALRALEAARLFRLLGEPRIVVSGGAGARDGDQNPDSLVLRHSLVDLGVPGDRILIESQSQNTREQALFLRQFLQRHGIDTFVLVTSRSHMWRSMETFEAQGLHPIASAADDHSGDSGGEASRFIPSLDALRASQAALREYLALLYYWGRGWLNPL